MEDEKWNTLTPVLVAFQNAEMELTCPSLYRLPMTLSQGPVSGFS